MNYKFLGSKRAVLISSVIRVRTYMDKSINGVLINVRVPKAVYFHDNVCHHKTM